MSRDRMETTAPIIAAPPDKIQYISPSMQETLLVMTDEKVSYVEEYFNGAV